MSKTFFISLFLSIVINAFLVFTFIIPIDEQPSKVEAIKVKLSSVEVRDPPKVTVNKEIIKPVESVPLRKKAIKKLVKIKQTKPKKLSVKRKKIIKTKPILASRVKEKKKRRFTRKRRARSRSAKRGAYKKKLKRLLRTYQLRVREQVLKHMYYPRLAMLQELEGRVIVSFKVLSSGEIINISLYRPSNVNIFNESSIDIVKLASPVDPIPKQLGMRKLDFKIPLKYTRE